MKTLRSTIVLFIFFLLSFQIVSAEVNPKTLLSTADSQIFIKAGFSQDYHEAQGYVNEFTKEGVLHQFFIKDGKCTDILTTLQPSPGKVSVTNKRLKFIDRRAKVFHASMEITQSESLPKNTSHCWIRYSDVAVTGPGLESGIILYPGEKAFSYFPVDGVMQYKEIADISNFNNKTVKVDIIRLDGISYFYLNKTFAFQYEDGITNMVSFEAGSELLEGSNRIRCDFDNFIFLAQ